MFSIDDIVFTRIKQGVSKKLKTKYPDITFTTNNREIKDAKFPCVYAHLLGSPERGQDLEGNSINAGYFTFQIEVYDNKTQKRSKEVMESVLMVMKSMRFEINFPEIQNVDDVYRSVARCSRIIGSGDVL